MTDYSPVIYLVNSDNIIVEVNQNWDAFAHENNGENVAQSEVVGRSVLDFVTGKVTRNYWQELLNRARDTLQPMTIDYRCDAPSLKRWMRMELQREENGNLRISHQQLATAPRSKPIHFKPARHRGQQTHIRCSFCSRIKIKEHWHEADDAAHHSNEVTHTDGHTFHVTYGLCGECVKPENSTKTTEVKLPRSDNA